MPPAIVTGSYDPDDAMETTSLLATRSREGSVVGGGNHRDGSIIEIVAETVIEVIDLRDPSKVNNSPYATIMMLLNTAIAACFVAQPYIFMTAGVGSTIAEYIFINIGIYTGVEAALWFGSTAEIAPSVTGQPRWCSLARPGFLTRDHRHA